MQIYNSARARLSCNPFWLKVGWVSPTQNGTQSLSSNSTTCFYVGISVTAFEMQLGLDKRVSSAHRSAHYSESAACAQVWNIQSQHQFTQLLSRARCVLRMPWAVRSYFALSPHPWWHRAPLKANTRGSWDTNFEEKNISASPFARVRQVLSASSSSW